MKLTKRNNVWWIDYTANGKRHRQSTGTGNKSAAETWMRNLLRARQMPTFELAVEVLRSLYDKPQNGHTALGAIYEVYLSVAKSTGRDALAKETLRNRKTTVARFVKWCKEKRPTVTSAEGVTGPVAAGFAAQLKEEGLKTKTRRNLIGELSSVWSLLEKSNDRIKNPWTKLMPQDTDGERGKAFTQDEEERVLAAAKTVGGDWWPICVIMRHTGLRYGDVANLRWEEIDGDILKHKPIKTIRHNIEVILPLIEPVKEALATLTSRERSDFLFPIHAEFYSKRGTRWQAGCCFSKVLKAAGISGKGYTIHSWRHTAATRLAEAGADIETRKRILGHTVDTTAERYDHASHVESTREALERALKG